MALIILLMIVAVAGSIWLGRSRKSSKPGSRRYDRQRDDVWIADATDAVLPMIGLGTIDGGYDDARFEPGGGSGGGGGASGGWDADSGGDGGGSDGGGD